jgi:hypothetical protein
VKRRPTSQDITWFLDLNAKNQLDLDPPYQRKSVWTPKDRRFFLDTILRDYPTAPIFLHKTVSEAGDQKFHVVDGKQRLETIILFSQDKIRAPQDFGDEAVNNKKFSGLPKERKEAFWNYILTVEMLGSITGDTVNHVFDRLNRNSRKLTRQELRHARFDGEFASFVETNADEPFWSDIGISTNTRVRRMRDTEFVAELFLLCMHGVEGFDPDRIDQYFVDYDEEIPGLSKHSARFKWIKDQVSRLNEIFPLAGTRFVNYADFYSLFAAINNGYPKKLDVEATREKLQVFLKRLESNDDDPNAQKYLNAVRGASSDEKERRERIAIIDELLVFDK